MNNGKRGPGPEGKKNTMPGGQGGMKPKGRLIPIFKRLFRYILVYKKTTILIMAGFLISAMLSLTPALIVKIALDRYLVPGKTRLLIAAGALIVAAALFQALLDFVTRYYAEVNGQKAVYSIRRQVYAHLMELSFTYYDKARTGDILSRLTSDVEHFNCAQSPSKP